MEQTDLSTRPTFCVDLPSMAGTGLGVVDGEILALVTQCQLQGDPIDATGRQE